MSAKEALGKREISAVELFNLYTEKIKKEDKTIRAYIETFDYEEYEKGSLAGIPAAIKDNILIKNRTASAGSKILKNFSAPYDATAIARLKKSGVTFLGRTNMDEFAMGSSTENSSYGPTKNPVDTGRVPGGSSGGSAVAVKADMCVFALGSDTGGSVRQPASFCGIVGFKPTYGRVSRHGLISMASSLDQIGTLTKNVADSALVLKEIMGKDPFDSTTADVPVPELNSLDRGVKGLNVGVPKEFFSKGLSPSVEKEIKKGITILKKLGCNIKEVSLPNSEYALAVYYILMPSEVSSNLARFDGIRYGHSSKKAKDLIDTYNLSREEGFGAEAKRRIILGTHTLSAGYYEAFYMKAQKVRELLKKDFKKVFSEVDVIVGPSSPTTAFKLGELTDPLSMYLSDIYTVPVNLAGLPAISIPCGTDDNKLPVGFQIIGKAFDEETVLQTAMSLEKELN